MHLFEGDKAQNEGVWSDINDKDDTECDRKVANFLEKHKIISSDI